jgi:hemerythrin-like domain-containing protein
MKIFFFFHILTATGFKERNYGVERNNLKEVARVLKSQLDKCHQGKKGAFLRESSNPASLKLLKAYIQNI